MIPRQDSTPRLGPDDPTEPELPDLDDLDVDDEQSWDVLTEHGTRLAPGD